MKGIQSKLHTVGTYDLNKMSLSCFDDKRFVLDDEINTLAYFTKILVWFIDVNNKIKSLLMRLNSH